MTKVEIAKETAKAVWPVVKELFNTVRSAVSLGCLAASIWQFQNGDIQGATYWLVAAVFLNQN